MFLAQFFGHKHIINVYKTFNYDKNQVLYYNVQGSKKWIF
jgi:hypothetical protein